MNDSDNIRYMFKFLFMRLHEPLPVLSPKIYHIPDILDGSSNERHKDLLKYTSILAQSSWNWINSMPNELLVISHTALNQNILMLDDPDEWVRLHASATLALAGEYRILYNRLKDDDKQVRLNAAKGLSLSPPTEEFISFLLSNLESDDHLKFILIFILSEIAPPDPAVIDKIKQLAVEGDDQTRRFAVEAISRIFDKIDHIDKDTIDLLCSLLNDPDDQVRYLSSLAFATFGNRAKQSIPNLIKSITSDHNRYVFFQCLVALREMKDESANNFLLDYLWTSRWDSLTTPLSTW